MERRFSDSGSTLGAWSDAPCAARSVHENIRGHALRLDSWGRDRARRGVRIVLPQSAQRRQQRRGVGGRRNQRRRRRTRQRRRIRKGGGGGKSGRGGRGGGDDDDSGRGGSGIGGAGVTDAGGDAPSVPCGTNSCTGGTYCCNPTCGVCAPRGALCAAQICGADAKPAFDAFGCVAIPALDSADCSLPRPPHLYSCIISVLPEPCTVLNIGDITNTFCCP